MEYEDCGYLVTGWVGDNGLHIDPDNPKPVVKCLGCGAIISGGYATRQKHDAFHVALGEMFSAVFPGGI